jgi:hypothetical protein
MIVALIGLPGSGKTTAGQIFARTKGIHPLVVRSLSEATAVEDRIIFIRILRPAILDGIVSYITLPSTTYKGETAAIVADFTVHNGGDEISLTIILHQILGCIGRRERERERERESRSSHDPVQRSVSNESIGQYSSGRRASGGTVRKI